MMASSRTGWIPSFTLYFLVLFCLSSLGIDFCWAQGKLTVERSGGDRKVDTQSDSEEEDAAPINSVMPDMTFSGLLPLNDSLFCLLDEDGSYCLMKDIDQVDPIVITSLAELSKITEDALDDFCMMRKVSHCSRLMQALVVEPDGPMSRNIPRGTACARHADGTYCMSNFVKMTKIPDIDRCWFQRMKGFCSPSCAKTFRKMVEVLGCCARPATILLGSIGNTDALSALQICPGFENISSIVDQNCGGLSKVGPSKAVQEVSFTLDIPCNLLDFLENTLETLFRDEISDIADAETKHISAVRMSCSKLPISSGMHYTENSHLNLMRIPGTKLHATTVTFRITSGLIADEVASILLQRLQTRGSYFSFPTLTALVRSLFVDSPLVTVLDAPKATSNQALAQHLGNAECDPLKFLDVVTKCWELLEVYTQSTTDDEVEWSEHIMCDSMSPCAQALKALGTENLVHCKPMPRAGGLIGLSYMYIMCERNEAGIPCSRYLRMEDLVYFCKQLPMDECMVEKDCLWDKNSGQCAMSPQPNYLQGFCGTCHNKLVDVSTMLAPQNSEIPPLTSSSLTSMCMRSRNVYCSEIFAQDVHVLVQTPTGQSTAATHGLLRSDDFCGADDAQRCHRMALILSAQRTRLEADACTAHPFLCVDKVEYALKQDLITQSFLKYGCLMDADGRQRCMDRTDMLTPEAMTCYAQSLIAPTCDERCAQIWKTELSSLGCCIQHMDTYLESLDADQVPMHLRGLRKLQACIPDVAQLLSNPLCKESITQGKAIEKVVQFDVPCSLVTDELKQILVEKLPEDLSLAAGVPREFVKVTSVTCQLGTKVSQTTTYHTEKGKIKNDGQPSSENGLITVSYEIKAQDQEETQAASEAIDAFVEAHGELMWLEVSFAEVLGQAYDVNFSQ